MPAMTPIEPQPQFTRRECVRALGGGLGGVALAALLGEGSAAAELATNAASSALPAIAPAAHAATQVVGPHFRPRAKRVIQLFMNGGPFQADLFDPKPLLDKYAGQRPAEVQFRTENQTGGLLPVPWKFSPSGRSGLPISELLPETRKFADDLCVIRSLHCDNPNHGPALFQMNNGTILPTRPTLGAWMTYGLGSETDELPGYVVLCPGRPVRFSELWTSAFLPGEHQGTYVNHGSLAPDKMIPNVRNSRLSPAEQRSELDLVARLNRRHADARAAEPQLEARMRTMETAYRMQFAASEAFDVAREPEQVREAYGKSHYANGCLLARRLIERGVRFVQVYYGNGQPFDTHRNHNETAKKLYADIDRPTAALLGDLKARGLLEDTLVIWGGEFGRTSTTEGGNGRDHNHWANTIWMAGGGTRGGTAYGATDDFGFRAVENKMHVHDLHATILHLLGLDHERLTYRHAGRDFRLTDVYGRVVHEIMA
jgi:hypothetical protein